MFLLPKSPLSTLLRGFTDFHSHILPGVDLAFLEANHDVDMLKKGSYPWALKKRILGERGHLSNVCAGQTLGEIMSGRLKYVFLGHLSSENNEPHLAFDTVRGILEETGVKVGKTVELDMASRYSNSRTIALGS